MSDARTYDVGDIGIFHFSPDEAKIPNSNAQHEDARLPVDFGGSEIRLLLVNKADYPSKGDFRGGGRRIERKPDGK